MVAWNLILPRVFRLLVLVFFFLPLSWLCRVPGGERLTSLVMLGWKVSRFSAGPQPTSDGAAGRVLGHYHGLAGLLAWSFGSG